MEKGMERIALTIIEACQVAGISRTSLYAAIGRGELAARKSGRRTLVLVDDLKEWISSLPLLSLGGSMSNSTDLLAALDYSRFDVLDEYLKLGSSYWTLIREAALKCERLTVEVHSRQIAAVTGKTRNREDVGCCVR
jgi:excisionase family DNA binding protein